MRRREFITLLGCTAVACPRAALAQPSVPVIGFLNSGTPDDYAPQLAGFRQGLREIGYTEGQNVAIEFRWAETQYDRLPGLAADLVRRQVAVIVATGGAVSAIAAKSVTATIPIVFTLGGDPVQVGLVTSLNRPGGNVTGVSLFNSTLAAKRLQLLHELVPAARVIAMLINPANPNIESVTRAVEAEAPRIGLQIVVLKASSAAEIETAFGTLSQHKVEAVLVGGDAAFDTSWRNQVIALAARYAVPAIYNWRDIALAGGLASYGSSFAEDTGWLGFTRGGFSEVKDLLIYRYNSRPNLNS
jgi:ABC-type uncharacterized transport system substrate-binding protein